MEEIEENSKSEEPKEFYFVPVSQSPGGVGFPPQGGPVLPLSGMPIPVLDGSNMPPTLVDEEMAEGPTYEELERDEEETKEMIRSLD